MCAACGIPTHVVPLDADPVLETPPAAASGGAGQAGTTGPAAPRKFAALAHRDCRTYLVFTMLSMMGDNIEHVLTYWVLNEKFHSPGLVSFAIFSHWIPFLTLSVFFGGLADRYDCRRVIQAGQVLFMAVSATWAVLLLTGTLQVWHAGVLLVLHGIAGSLWAPGEQLMLQDFVGREDLPSAVRLNATFRGLGILLGPVVGGLLLTGLGSTAGLFVNICFYLPLTVFLLRTKYTGHTRHERGPQRVRLTPAAALRVLVEVGRNRTLVSMIAMAGLTSFFIGTALQNVMPVFAHDLAPTHPESGYSVLLFANGVGGVLGGFLLEATGRIPHTVRAAFGATLAFGLAMLGFALFGNFALACGLLVVGGVANLTSMSITQTVVQLLAPADRRGQVVGVYGMSASGLRTGSGLTVGLLSAVAGVHFSLAVSAGCICVGAALIALYAARGRSTQDALLGVH